MQSCGSLDPRFVKWFYYINRLICLWFLLNLDLVRQSCVSAFLFYEAINSAWHCSWYRKDIAAENT